MPPRCAGAVSELVKSIGASTTGSGLLRLSRSLPHAGRWRQTAARLLSAACRPTPHLRRRCCLQLLPTVTARGLTPHPATAPRGADSRSSRGRTVMVRSCSSSACWSGIAMTSSCCAGRGRRPRRPCASCGRYSQSSAWSSRRPRRASCIWTLADLVAGAVDRCPFYPRRRDSSGRHARPAAPPRLSAPGHSLSGTRRRNGRNSSGSTLRGSARSSARSGSALRRAATSG